MFTYTGPYESVPTEHDEIDFEIFGKDPTTMQVNYWRNGKEHPKLINLGFNASQNVHTYSFTWTQTSLSWYVDGILVHTVQENGLDDNDSLPINAGKIMLNLWAGIGVDAWTGSYSDGMNADSYYEEFKYETIQ